MPDIRDLKGLVACVVTTGDVKHQFSTAFSDLRDWNSRNGYVNIEYRLFDAKLVESGRDNVCRHALEQRYAWLVMIDADAAPFPPESVALLLNAAFVERPDAHVVGAYAQLKQPPYLPTMDTGTGTWEVHYPDGDLVPVIRTGGHFILVKTDILQRMGPPWFRSRIAYTPLKAMVELDNFARTHLSGRNPLREHPEWDSLVSMASKASQPPDPAALAVGEDSGFCDAVKAAGGNIYVDTRVVAGHVADRIITPLDLREELRKLERFTLACVGVRNYE